MSAEHQYGEVAELRRRREKYLKEREADTKWLADEQAARAKHEREMKALARYEAGLP